MVFEMALQHCSSQGCEEMPTFAGPRSSEEVVWACDQHGAKLEREEGVKMYALVPICQGGGAYHPCGQDASHVVVDTELRPISTCAQHVERV